MAVDLKSSITEATGQEIIKAIRNLGGDEAIVNKSNRVTSLNSTPLKDGSKVIEAIGIPVYVDDVSQYSAYGITEKGWYIFARIGAPDDVSVSNVTTVTGANAIVVVGADYVDVAVMFDVAAMAKVVVIGWNGSTSETFIFRASDLAVRNLDYRTTFYVYDISPYATWEYALTADTTFQEGKKYFTKSGEVYGLAEVDAYSYALTADETFQTGKTYYTKGEDDTYTAVTVTAGEAVTPDTYYERSAVPVPAYYVQTHPYALTKDTTFTDGKTYYIKGEDGTYTPATVTVGEAVPADTYYEQTTAYEQAAGTFENGVTYYTKSGTEYTEAVITIGDPIPAYYNHSKVIFQGMARNVTYQFDEIVDCPQEYVLPEIEDDGHGAWFEIRLRHAGSYSSTLVVPEGVKIATEHTQAETAGMNMVDLHYMSIDGIKIWRFMNTHSSIPTT